MNFDLQAHRSLREIVYEELKTQIIKGELPPGTRMMEIELTQHMGVSRTPVREAIGQLERENLITIKNRKGACVSDFTKEEIHEVLEVKSNIDGLAASLAASRITQHGAEHLRAICCQYTDAVQNGDPNGMIHFDMKFHQTIAESTGNQVLGHMIQNVQQLLLRFHHLCYKQMGGLRDETKDHKLILEAICQENSEEARKEAIAHIEGLKELPIE